jgi:hypothetical protein
MPLPDGVRRFLAPAVGIDPAEVPIHRGERAESATTAHRADAITDGAEIALAAGNDTTESPETLGLIAHELTHIARQRDPLFVPPIVRPRSPSPQTAPAAAVTSAAPLPGPSADEETIAEAVEARVVRAAEADTPLIEQSGTATARRADDSPPRQAERDSASVSLPPAQAGDAPDRWGDLPRPWEPLPAWLTEPSDTPAAAPPWTNMLVMSAPIPAPMPALQRADEGRSQIQEATGSQLGGPAQQPDHPTVEPDLDALSRQVYAILKRRLATERRSAR